jgi:nucleoside-diphosphate-sugar epimerase
VVVTTGNLYAPADLDAPHSRTYVGDVARTLIAVAADESAWGRARHVPTPRPMSIRALATVAFGIQPTTPSGT